MGSKSSSEDSGLHASPEIMYCRIIFEGCRQAFCGLITPSLSPPPA
jgi:hypothetical protein